MPGKGYALFGPGFVQGTIISSSPRYMYRGKGNGGQTRRFRAEVYFDRQNTGTGDVGFVRPRIFIQETSIISSCELFAPRNRKWRDRLGGSGPRFIAVGRQ